MEKKYQVFISSTYADLIEERKKVMDVLLMADCIPAGMEAFVATDIDQFEVIKKVIDLCDYYVLIIGKCYCSIHPETGISYTEMEYDYAIKRDIPVLVFALDDSMELSSDKKDVDEEKIEKLRIFRNKAMKNRLASIWHSADELTGKLAIAIMKAKTEIIRPGWQRGTDYDEVSLRREIMTLQNNNKALKDEVSQKEQALSDYTKQDDLAFENQPIVIQYSYLNDQGTDYCYGDFTTDLKTIFVIIATEMMDVALTETTITSVLARELPFPKTNFGSDFRDKHFVKRMLNQFRALSLIQSRWNEQKNLLYWHLTSKGKKTRDDSILIKKEN